MLFAIKFLKILKKDLSIFFTQDYQARLIIFLCSILLGIWPILGTIGLRNLLLITASLISINYIWKWLGNGINFSLKSTSFRSEIVYWLPCLLLIMMFLWVTAHYIFFSKFPERQWKELSSTWTRAFLASIIGFGCALALSRNRPFAWLLWLGPIVIFVVLIFQYISKVIDTRSLIVFDYYGYYILYPKFNGALLGVLLFAGTLGLFIDNTFQKYPDMDMNKKDQYNKSISVVFSALGIILPIYAFVFILNTKNGVGVAILLIFYWLIVGLIYLFFKFLLTNSYQSLNRKWIYQAIFYFASTIFLIGIMSQQLKINPGWKSLIEDIKTSSQIDAHHNWKNTLKYGYPINSDGSNVTGNTYERVSWGAVGLRLIIDQPLGNGLLRSFQMEVRKIAPDFSGAAYTHSAWIDLGLSYGWPGLTLLPILLLSCQILCIKRYRGPYRFTVLSLSASFLVLYLVGEYAFNHGIEILCFTCALLSGLIVGNLQSRSNDS